MILNESTNHKRPIIQKPYVYKHFLCLVDEDAKDEKSSESSNEDDFISNPYPVMIMPKFSQLPVKQDKHKITGITIIIVRLSWFIVVKL